ncbi:RNA polymerase sigma factor [Neobacillus mesonae]|nr:RNA polymerase sigma factor [Neobacillus mesonae]
MLTSLVKQAKKGSKEALLRLIMDNQDEYYRLAYTYMGNEQDAMDALADMIVILYEKIEQLQKSEAFHSWSKTILVNRCKTLLRQNRKLVPLEDDKKEVISILTDTTPFLYLESEIDIKELLSHLSAQQREAILLRFVHDLPYQASGLNKQSDEIAIYWYLMFE